MPTAFSLKIQEILSRISESYYKLVLVVGPAHAGKTAALMSLSVEKNWQRLNVSLNLSERLLDLSNRQRASRVAAIMQDFIHAQASKVLLLDNIELIFASELSQDPLRLLQSISRDRIIVAAWPGNFDGKYLTYGESGHPEARRYSAPQASIVKVDEVERFGRGLAGERSQ